MIGRSGQVGFEFYPGEETYIVKSVGDVSMYDPTACKINDPNDPWIPNSVGAGRMYSMQYRPSDGAVGDPEQVEVGEGTMCFQFPNFNFTPFEGIKSRGNLSINDFTVRFEGRCMVTNRDMQEAGIHQMTCARCRWSGRCPRLRRWPDDDELRAQRRRGAGILVRLGGHAAHVQAVTREPASGANSRTARIHHSQGVSA